MQTIKNKVIACAVLAAALGTVSAQASLVAGDVIVDRVGTAHSGNGGEFRVVVGAGWGFNPLTMYSPLVKDGNSFRSFCLETDEYSSAGKAVINSMANGGGRNTNDGDPLSYGTAWLYSQFAQGILKDYNYSDSSRSSDAGVLQAAIWGLEDEQGYSGPPVPATSASNNFYYNLAVTYFGSESAAKANAPAGYLGVYALNITNNGVNKQDMLFYVPEPSTVFIGFGALGLLGVSAFRKSRRPTATTATVA